MWYQNGIIADMSLTFRTNEQIDQILEDLAAVEQRSKQEVLERLVLEAGEKLDRRARFEAAYEQVMNDLAPVLERLKDN